MIFMLCTALKNIKFINSSEINKFSERLGKLPGVSNIDIISAKNDIEY